ncbi:phage tail protein I [Acinetobacter higginsii]|uniref:Phage tail protein I n=1 Tax=Acinetobacter higginsii TaxID=70347 RepID=N8XJQ6_9GAMM|nr:phage tail protein I [Acinetobacter higginsii]ENV09294.1 phage tail protein I [Acinetobacter higginsii]
MKQLLPPNSTKLELNVSKVLENTTNLAIDIKKLVNPSDIPSQFLPHLAWQNSVDRWNRTWPDEFKRKQIQIAFDLHRRKGTVSALRSVVNSFGFDMKITEWWQLSNAVPGTFYLDIEMNGKPFEQTDYNIFIDLLNDNKPLTRHLTSINFKAERIQTRVLLASATYDGHVTVIYPELPVNKTKISMPAVHFDHQVTSIFPQV